MADSLLSLSLFPFYAGAQKNLRDESRDRRPRASLIFYWSGNGQSAWGIETGSHMTTIMIGGTSRLFPVLEGEIILPFEPEVNYVSSLFQINLEYKADGRRMAVWFVVSQLGLSHWCSVDRITQRLHETLLSPAVKEGVQKGLVKAQGWLVAF